MLTSRTERAAVTSAAQPAVVHRVFPALFVVSLLVVLASPWLISRPSLDWLNIVAALTAFYLLCCIVAPRRILGHVGFVARSLSNDASVSKLRGSFVLSP